MSAAFDQRSAPCRAHHRISEAPLRQVSPPRSPQSLLRPDSNTPKLSSPRFADNIPPSAHNEFIKHEHSPQATPPNHELTRNHRHTSTRSANLIHPTFIKLTAPSSP